MTSFCFCSHVFSVRSLCPAVVRPFLFPLSLALLFAGCADPESLAAVEDPDETQMTTVKLVDPGSGPWQPVPEDKVAEVCELDPALLKNADALIKRPLAVVRHGRLC